MTTISPTAAPSIMDEDITDDWAIWNGDSTEVLAHLPDRSADLAVFSPPFGSLYTYSPSERDLGNCADDDEFFTQYRMITEQIARVMRPGRIVACHVAQITTQKWRDGVIGLSDFRGDVIRMHQEVGFTFHGEVTVDKDPQAAAVRTKAKGLLFVQMKKDSSWSRPTLADYVLLFRCPGDNDIPIDRHDVTNDEWIQWARPVWYNIRESDTLNASEGRENDDERHIAPLQLSLIERCVRLWSNPGETVLSPFAGIGSEGVGAIRNRRRFVGVELKPAYWRVARRNLRKALNEREAGTLFDHADGDAG